jgi:hypothetical protein
LEYFGEFGDQVKVVDGSNLFSGTALRPVQLGNDRQAEISYRVRVTRQSTTGNSAMYWAVGPN